MRVNGQGGYGGQVGPDPFDMFEDVPETGMASEPARVSTRPIRMPSQQAQPQMMPQPQMAPGPVRGTGMHVVGYSNRKPSLYDKNPVAVITLVVGFLAMLATLVPNIGSYVAMPMGACAVVLGVVGIMSAKKHGNDRGDFAVAGIVLGIASAVISVAALLISGSILADSGTDSLSMANQSGDESLVQLAASAAATEAYNDITGNDWGTGETRMASSEVMSFHNDLTFTGWTVDYDGNQSKWQGEYVLYFGKEAIDVVPEETAEVIYEEIERTPKFTERGLVAIQMDVNEIDGDRSHPVRLIMIGHYISETHQLYMREAVSPKNTPTVLHRLDDHESGLS